MYGLKIRDDVMSSVSRIRYGIAGMSRSKLTFGDRSNLYYNIYPIGKAIPLINRSAHHRHYPIVGAKVNFSALSKNNNDIMDEIINDIESDDETSKYYSVYIEEWS